jgi:hypothetical protein
MSIMDKAALTAHYAALKEQQGKVNKEAPEYYAYHQIGTALASEDAEKALKDKIEHCHDAIAKKPEHLQGYRWFYGRMIEHFETARNEVDNA